LKKQLAACIGLLLLCFATTRLAQAQSAYMGPGIPNPALPPYEIMSIVRSTGLAPLTRPMRRGPYYVLVAVDRVGRQMRVVVDAQLGDIVNLRPALAAGSYGPELGRPTGFSGGAAALPEPSGPATAYGPHPGGDGAQPPMPPRPIPSARAVNPPNAVNSPTMVSPPRLAVAEPALPPPPPLPRPRPKLALNEVPAAVAPAAAPAAPAAAAAPAGPPATSAGAANPPASAAAPAAPSGGNETAKPIE
jgi:hypothetical protein